jgi:hypothetical protein
VGNSVLRLQLFESLAPRTQNYNHNGTCGKLWERKPPANVDYVSSMLLYGCFYGLDYVVLLWSELCVCQCLLHDTSICLNFLYLWFPCSYVPLALLFAL